MTDRRIARKSQPQENKPRSPHFFSSGSSPEGFSASSTSARPLDQSEREKNINAHLASGDKYMQGKDHQKAVNEYRKVFGWDAQNSFALMSCGKAYEAMGKLNEASTHYEQAFSRNPSLAEAKNALDRIRRQSTSSKEALQMLPLLVPDRSRKSVTTTSSGESSSSRRAGEGRSLEQSLPTDQRLGRSDAEQGLEPRLGGYRLLERIGGGASGDVYRGKPLGSEELVAVKVLRDCPNINKFLQEAAILKRLKHEHIIELKAFGAEHNIAYLVMPYATDGTLADYLVKNGPLSLEKASEFGYQIAAALDFAHRNGVQHRDIKRENILLTIKDGKLIALVSDFGLAQEIHNSASQKTSVAGTWVYMAPEQMEGKACPASDQWAFTVTIYEAVSGGQLPFDNLVKQITAAPKPLPGISQAWQRALFKALEKKPDDRYPNNMALIQELDKARGVAALSVGQERPELQKENLENLIEAHFESGKKHLLQAGQYEKARDDFHRVIALDETHASAHMYLGETYGMMKQYNNSEHYLLKAIEIDPNSPRAHVCLGSTYGFMERFEDAEQCILKAIEIDPNDVRYIRLIFQLYRVMGKSKEALAALDQVEALDPSLGGIEKARDEIRRWM